MYNFNFMKDEVLIDIFNDVLIMDSNNNERFTDVALTDKRLLFLDYITDNLEDALRITGKLNLVRTKEVYCDIDLNDISSIDNEDYYIVNLKDGNLFKFNNLRLYKLLLDSSNI